MSPIHDTPYAAYYNIHNIKLVVIDIGRYYNESKC